MNMTTSPAFARQLPVLDDLNQAFWTGGAAGKLLIAKCSACGLLIHPPQPICTKCKTKHPLPTQVSGLGRILSYTVNHQAWYPTLPVPFVVAVVELDEQPNLRIMTNIVDCPVEKVHIDQRVEVSFEQHEDVWLPLFKPVDAVRSWDSSAVS